MGRGSTVILAFVVYMSFSLLVKELFYAGLCLQAALAAVLLLKGLWRTLPFFSTYAVVNLAGSGLLYAVHGNPSAYFYTFWITEWVGVMLGLAVVYEVFQKMLVPHAALHRLAKLVFQIAAVVLVLLGAAVIYLQSPAGAQGLSRAVMVVEEAARVVEIGLLMFLFLFSTVFGLHWRQHEFGIALGLGIFVAVDLISVTMEARMGSAASATFSIIRGASFDSSLLIWLGYILVPERIGAQGEVPKRAQLEQWNRAMMELINQ